MQSKPGNFHLWSMFSPEISLGLCVRMSGSREGTLAIIRCSEGKDPKEIKNHRCGSTSLHKGIIYDIPNSRTALH